MGFSLRARDAPRTRWPFNPTRATRARLARAWFGLAPFRSPLLRRDLTSSGYVRCFSSPAYLHTGYVFTGGSQGITLWGCPIRTSSAPSLLAAPRGISLLRHVLHRHERARHPPDALRHGLTRRRPGLPASPTTRDQLTPQPSLRPSSIVNVRAQPSPAVVWLHDRQQPATDSSKGRMVEMRRLELLTPSVQRRCSPN